MTDTGITGISCDAVYREGQIGIRQGLDAALEQVFAHSEPGEPIVVVKFGKHWRRRCSTSRATGLDKDYERGFEAGVKGAPRPSDSDA